MSRRPRGGVVELDPGAELPGAQEADVVPAATRLRSPFASSPRATRATRNASRGSSASSQPQPRSLVADACTSPAVTEGATIDAAAAADPAHSTPSAAAADPKGKGAARPQQPGKPGITVAAGQAAPTWSRAAAAAATSSVSYQGSKKGKGKGKSGGPSLASNDCAASVRDPHAGICTTEYAYDNGVPIFPKGKRIPVITPRFTRNAPLKDNGHPDLTSVTDDVVRKKMPEENLSDQRYDKRHQQFELSERKRKKWGGQTTAFDFHQEQRKRRDAEKQRLKELQETASTAPATDAVQEKGAPFSFWPDITKDHAKSIMVTDVLPVVAFGCGVPRFDRRIAFNLPQTGINAMILPKLKVEEAKTAAKPATDGPAASSGRRKRVAKKTYDPDKNGDFNDGVPIGILSEAHLD